MVTRSLERPADMIVFEQLTREFGDRIDPGTIRRVAVEEVALFDGAKVRDFIPVIATRLARARLNDELAGITA